MSNKITKKQKDFADEYLETGNATKSALKAYDTEDENTASSIGSNNTRKHNIIEYLEEQSEGAANRIIELSKTAKNENVKLNSNKDILDRAGYKPKEKVEHSGQLTIKDVLNYGKSNNTPTE